MSRVVLYYNQKGKRKSKEKEKKKMPPIDLTLASAHVYTDRKERLNAVYAIGVGFPAAIFEEYKDGQKVVVTLTSTGLVVIRSTDNMIITLYIPSVSKAKRFYRIANGKEARVPQKLIDNVIMNNVMFPID